ncbi:MAG: sigma-70 family RNA polymerase sigma factor [Ruminococcaceae bacterium]|nr:sigma-70 family RNA polymerase sigma factor [Oscillospiraceae bacterium]
MNDANIIRLYNDRDERAITETKEKYGNYCYSIAYNILGNDEDAKEVVNDAYLAVWKAIPPENPHYFSSFIGKITRNIAFNRHRQRSAKKRNGSVADISLEELTECLSTAKTLEAELEEKDLTRILDEFLLSISARDRRVFVRRYWYLDKISDISEKYSYSESKVKMILLRTRKKLIEKLRKENIK